ncbi:MAG: hypothetical protein JWQ74_3573 [Marmoricola sp.]|nr:hypothetical protein [Marmoricola sp.]
MTRERQLKYRWERTWPDIRDDYTCFFADVNIGRVQYHTSGPVRFWKWFMAVDDLSMQIAPMTGTHDDKIEACRQLEAAFDAAVAKA